MAVRPISRKPESPSGATRQGLGIPAGSRMVLVTMGGTAHEQAVPCTSSIPSDVHLVVPGGGSRATVRGNTVLLPYHSRFYHPDLIAAADAVVGKVGYSTVAEVYHSGVAFGYVTRPSFRESAVLSGFVEACIPGFEIDATDYEDGTWVGRLPDLLSSPRRPRGEPNGADQVAALIHQRLS